jgi:hypothetical protein
VLNPQACFLSDTYLDAALRHCKYFLHCSINYFNTYCPGALPNFSPLGDFGLRALMLLPLCSINQSFQAGHQLPVV